MAPPPIAEGPGCPALIELADIPRWVCWRTERRDGKLSKVPYTTGLQRASHSDPETWDAFEACRLVAFVEGRADGVGIVLDGSDDLIGVDLDDCVNGAGVPESWAQAIADQLDSYTEISPSGTGLRIFVRGSLPCDGRRKGPVEMYRAKRVLSVTGWHLAGTPDTIEARPEALLALYRERFGDGPVPGAEGNGPAELPDPLDEARLAEERQRFPGLFNYAYDSASERDYALACHACRRGWPREDAAALIRAERRDGKGNRPDYVWRTVARAYAESAPKMRRTRFPAAEGAQLLEDVRAFLGRFIAYPSEAAGIAHTLWIAHAHLMDAWESTPRIAFLSPEPASGKTRALETTELLVPRPVEAINVSPAYLFRKVGSPDGAPTILFDEIDTVFGPKARENEEIRGLLNAGHRRGAVAGRCVVHGKIVLTEEIPAYCAVALAGLGWLPDTLMTRSVVVRMRPRAPAEQIEPYRRRLHVAAGTALRDRLEVWAGQVLGQVASTWPEMPAGVEDRDADVWEALLAVADAAGGDWPQRAAEAAVSLVTEAKDNAPSLGVRLLSDLRTVFGEREFTQTSTILEKLLALDEAPWSDLKGKPLDARGLAYRLRQYGVKPHQERFGKVFLRGYRRADLADAWTRYLPPLAQDSDTSDTPDTEAPEAAETVDPGVSDAQPDGPAGFEPTECFKCGASFLVEDAALAPLLCDRCRTGGRG